MAGHGRARHGRAGQGAARHGEARHDEARFFLEITKLKDLRRLLNSLRADAAACVVTTPLDVIKRLEAFVENVDEDSENPFKDIIRDIDEHNLTNSRIVFERTLKAVCNMLDARWKELNSARIECRTTIEGEKLSRVCQEICGIRCVLEESLQ
jgi:hypothetical protein